MVEYLRILCIADICLNSLRPCEGVFEAFRTYHASSLFLDITSTRMHASTQIHRSQDCKEIEGDFFFQPSQTVSLLLWNQNEGQGEAEHESAFGGCFAPLLTRCLTSIMLL